MCERDGGVEPLSHALSFHRIGGGNEGMQYGLWGISWGMLVFLVQYFVD